MTDLVERLERVEGELFRGEKPFVNPDLLRDARHEITRLREEVETQKEIAAVALLMHENGKARIKELEAPATPEMIAAAWAAWHSRHGGNLGPGPAFVEAVNAALRSRTEGEG